MVARRRPAPLAKLTEGEADPDQLFRLDTARSVEPPPSAPPAPAPRGLFSAAVRALTPPIVFRPAQPRNRRACSALSPRMTTPGRQPMKCPPLLEKECRFVGRGPGAGFARRVASVRHAACRRCASPAGGGAGINPLGCIVEPEPLVKPVHLLQHAASGGERLAGHQGPFAVYHLPNFG